MRQAAIAVLRAVGHAGMWPLEIALDRGARLRVPPIFIVGPPRSGTSLLYEALITRFRFGYLSNLAHRFYRTPVAATWLGQRLIAQWRGDFSSYYGHISGWGAPNEGGWIWQRWLADGDWCDEHALASIDVVPLRRMVAGISRVTHAPFLNKNVMHSNRMRLIDAIWPGALFIEVRRDPADNARSIIRAERKQKKDGDVWWSVRPSVAPMFEGADGITRAVAQVLGVRRDIAVDGAALGGDHVLAVDYARFCEAPESTAAVIARWLGDRGIPVHPQERALPVTFTRPAKPLSPDDEGALAAALAAVRHDLDRETR